MLDQINAASPAPGWSADLLKLAPVGLDALVALVILVACALIGYSLLPAAWLRRSRLALPLSLSAGCTVVGWSCWVAGSTIGTLAVLPLFLVLTLQALRVWRRFVGASLRCVRVICLVARSQPLLSLVLVLVIVSLGPQLLLPVADSDGLRYHLALPKLFLLTGRIFFYPYEFTGALPQLGETLYLLGLALARGECAKFLHTAMFVATLATLLLAVHRGRRTRCAAVMAPLAFAATPVALAVAAATFVDHIATFHCAAALLLVSAGAPPLATGVALAGALGTKISVAPAAAGLMLVVLLLGHKGRRLRSFAAMAVPVALVMLPFAIRNASSTGDPIFPIGGAVLGEPAPIANAAAVRFTTQFNAGSPTFLGITWGSSQGAAQADEIAGWHNLLALFGLVLVVGDRRLRVFAAPVAATLVLGLWFHPPTRLLLPMFLCLAAIGAIALARIARGAAAWIGLALVAPALLASVSFVLTLSSPFDYILGRVDRAGFLARFVPGWRAAQIVNAQPPGGLVMALGFPTPYYFDRPWIAEGPMVEPPLRGWIRDARSSGQVLARMRAVDVRYLVVTPTYGGGTPATLLPLAASPAAYARARELRNALRPVGSIDGVDVFQVPPAKPAQ